MLSISAASPCLSPFGTLKGHPTDKGRSHHFSDMIFTMEKCAYL
ncbi:MAG: hypothetical protein RID09_10280 [Coleofasciculus sp. G1-WW12-02]